MPLHAVKRTLEREGVSTPNGQPWWNTRTIKNVVLDDCYRPHTFKEIEGLVVADVAARFDPDELYGVWWYNQRCTTVRQVAEGGSEGRRYRRVQRTEKRPKSEWVAVPIPDARVPLQWVDAARKHVSRNVRTSLAGQRFWELSGGVLYCGGCDKRMIPDRTRSRPDRPYHFYYRCNTKHKRGKDACPMPKSFRADRLEPLVWEFVSELLKAPIRCARGLKG